MNSSSDKTVAGPRLPRTIGRYEITGRLGKGAMGVVYSARDAMMERSVAIKVMMADLEDDPETSSRFYREARSAGQLMHPNIITIFDMGQENGRPYIVMEFLDGETLNKYITRPEAADVEIKIELMIQICQGLHAAHSNGIFHRDIKPGNLLVRSNGDLKIVDFGIARLASSSMTASGLIMGTPDYMSPEQARGQDIDQRSDIFSAGAVFYFILTGRKPFAAPDLAAVLLKVQTEEPLPIRESEAPPTLARIVMKALAKNPADRYHTCGRMVAELEHLKRDLTSESLQQLDEAGTRLTALEALAAGRRSLIEKLSLQPAPPDLDAARLALVERHAAVTEPIRRTVVADLLGAVAAFEEPILAEMTRLRSAAKAFDEGMQAVRQDAPATRSCTSKKRCALNRHRRACRRKSTAAAAWWRSSDPCRIARPRCSTKRARPWRRGSGRSSSGSATTRSSSTRAPARRWRSETKRAPPSSKKTSSAGRTPSVHCSVPRRID